MSPSTPWEVSFEDLDREILEAHDLGDGARLARLYSRAAELLAANHEDDRAAFLLVNAYVWALEAGEVELASRAHRILVEMNREQ